MISETTRLIRHTQHHVSTHVTFIKAKGLLWEKGIRYKYLENAMLRKLCGSSGDEI